MDSFFKAKQLYPDVPDEVLNQKIGQFKEIMPGASDDELLEVATEMKTQGKSPSLDRYLAKQQVRQKYGIGDKFSPDARQKIVDENAAESGQFDWQAALAGLGQAISGSGNAGQAAMGVIDRKNQQRKMKLDEFDKGKAGSLENLDLDRKMAMAEREDMNFADAKALKEREADPTSPESQLAQQLAKKISPAMDFSKMSADKINKLLPSLSKIYEMEQRKMDRDEARMDRSMARNSVASARNEERELRRQERKEKEMRPSDKQIEAFTDLDNAASDIGNILSTLGNNKNWVGPIDGRIPDMLVGEDQAAWRSAVGKYKDAYRKAITGAGASSTELAMLERRLPSETDTPEQFVAKAKEAQKELQRKKAILAQNLTKGGKDVSKFVDPQDAVSTQQSAPTAKVVVSNGKETLEIDASDLADAEKDGFKRVK